MRTLASFLLIIMLLGSAACGNREEASKPLPQKAEPGGQLIYGSLQEPNTLNPLLSDLVATAEVSRLIFSGLVQMNDKGEWQGDLAVDAPTRQNGGVSADGLTVTYRLRTGVTWHDGTPFSSADVKFTWQLIMNRKASIVNREGYDKIASINTPDPATVVIHFREFYAPYLGLFSFILPEHKLKSVEDPNTAPFNRSPVGTGPFKFKEWRIGEALVLEANSGYFRGKPVLDGILYKIVPDSGILLSQLKNGELDIAGGLPSSLLDQVKGAPGVRAVVTPNMVWEHIDFNLDNHLFQDVRVRKAIALGIDRPGLISGLLRGVASPAVGDQSPLSWAYNPAMKQPGRDLGAARELLAQAGWKTGPDGVFVKDGRRLAFTLMTPSGNKTRENVALAIAQQLRELGVEVEVKLSDPGPFFAEVLNSRRFEAAMFAWVSGIDPDNSNLWNQANIPSGINGFQGQNYCGWRNPEVDKLTAQAAREASLEARKTAYFRIQELINQEAPVIPLYFRASVDALRDTVIGYKPNPTPTGSLWNSWEWGLTKKRQPGGAG